jgi:flagellar biosynthesis protein
MADKWIPPEISVFDTPKEKKTTEPLKPTAAVALKHERGEDSAPHIVASGKGAIAEQILQLAFAHNVKVREDADLVEVLGQLDIDSPIPLEAYAAVAEILAYVYRANSNK